jgi:hypothetical protein
MTGELWLRRIDEFGEGEPEIAEFSREPSRVRKCHHADWGGKRARVRKCRTRAGSERVRICRAGLGACDTILSGVRNTSRCFSCREEKRL